GPSSKARRAAATASSTSAGPAAATSAITRPSRGAATGSTAPSRLGMKEPPMWWPVRGASRSARARHSSYGTSVMVSPFSEQGVGTLDDLAAEGTDSVRVVDELRGLDAERREPLGELLGDALQRRGERRAGAVVGEAGTGSADHLQVGRVASRVRHRLPQAGELLG